MEKRSSGGSTIDCGRSWRRAFSGPPPFVLAAILVASVAVSAEVPELIAVHVPGDAQTTGDGPFHPLDRYVDGSRIVRVRPSVGAAEVLTPDFHSACDPAVSFDGTQILFAGRRARNDRWQIWRMAADGSDKVQLTQGDTHSISPLWVGSLFHLNDDKPTRRFVYVVAAHGWSDEVGSGPVMSLYACDLDGTRPWRISHNLSSDFDPDVLANGRLVYSSTRANGADGGTTALLELSIDGTDLMPYFGNHQAPARRETARVGSDGRVYFIEATARSWLAGGDLVSVSQRRPLHSYAVLSRAAGGSFLSPCTLADGRLLASFRPARQGGRYSLWAIDTTTGARLEEVYGAEGWHVLDAHELAARPPVKGRSSVVDMARETGVFYCLSSHVSDRPQVEALTPAQIHRLRVVEGVPGAGGTTRRILGVLPVESDGSFHIEVPAQTPITFQLLDAHGMAVARQHSWTWVMPREWRGCIGCHEDRELAAPNVLAEAVIKPAKRLTLPPERRRTVDFVHQVAPILDQHCGNCHTAGGSQPWMVGSPEESSREVYEALLQRGPLGETGWVKPGEARASALLRPPESVPGHDTLGEIERTQLIEWVDLGAAFDAQSEVAP